jgi:hypothetical protein
MAEYTSDQVNIHIQLSSHTEKIRRLQLEINSLVRDGRAAGMTWERIGIALGTSSQAAWEKFGLTFQQTVERSRQNKGALTNEQLAGLDLPPEVSPQKAGRKTKRPRGQADK